MTSEHTAVARYAAETIHAMHEQARGLLVLLDTSQGNSKNWWEARAALEASLLDLWGAYAGFTLDSPPAKAEPTRTTVLVHLNLELDTDSPAEAETWARLYCDEKGIEEDVVLLEAQ